MQSRKTPQRIKHLLPLMDQMLHRHGKCGYKPLRDLACPSKVSLLFLAALFDVQSLQ
ncbi:hypothetical protein BDN72DRAFT_758418 [Pluteus cervinus]|uniref:Uncharacterized protein n=1 Tax=Pluteus cervinus TaxID=181527 RepID=A0ACD3BC05_9AGAR|nr:hypothetical protein BDN72DRAFT_758418 [Pluteus cervinus]